MSGLPTNPSDAVRQRNPHLFPPMKTARQHNAELVGECEIKPYEKVTDTESPRQVAKLECLTGYGSLAAHQSQETTAGRLHIRFVSRRKRLCDPDNCSVKWQLDCLRYCGALSGDEPDKITLEVSQQKVGKGEREETIIEIYQQ